tara:strand:- start:11406 stop:12020 length:615 start_codon:yes stop_codon:yes gene_type:complete
MDGIGKLFGAKSPMEKVIDFAKGLQGVDMMGIFILGEAFKGLSESKSAIDMFDGLDGTADSVIKFASSIDTLTAALARLEKGVPAETTFFDKIKDVASQVKDFFGSGAGQSEVKPNVGSQASMPTAKTQVDQTAVPSMGVQYGDDDEIIDDLTGNNTMPTDPGAKKPDTPENDTAALLAELVRLQAENNKLSKKQISATEDIDF